MDNGESSYRRYLAGEQDAFDEVLGCYRAGLTFFIQRIVGQPETAEDIAIDVFVELLTHPRRYDGRASLKTYLYTLGRSRAIDHLRRQRRFSPEPVPEKLPAEGTPEEQYLADERKRSLHKALNTLPPDQKTALHLVYFEDLSYADTAKIMRKTPKQVDNLLYQGKARLRAILGKEGLQL